LAHSPQPQRKTERK
ncbi:unnamed protein product, partial [Rotaria sp. Silwood1]